MSKTIKLNDGAEALVDDEDYDFLMKWKWTHHNDGSAYRRRQENRKQKVVRMHRLIMNAPDGIEVDHKNRNKLDNRRTNLRLATSTQNMRNQGKRQMKTSSKYKGVCLDFTTKVPRWKAYITVEYKCIHLGRFDTEIEAAMAYDLAAKVYFGEFAVFNFAVTPNS